MSMVTTGDLPELTKIGLRRYKRKPTIKKTKKTKGKKGNK